MTTEEQQRAAGIKLMKEFLNTHGWPEVTPRVSEKQKLIRLLLISLLVIGVGYLFFR